MDSGSDRHRNGGGPVFRSAFVSGGGCPASRAPGAVCAAQGRERRGSAPNTPPEAGSPVPFGSYWNHCGYELSPGEENWSIVTEIPCDHEALGKEYCNSYRGATDEFFPFYDGSQCLGFSSMLSDQLFGADAPVSMHRSYERLRPGDQIRLTVENHSMLVIGKSEAGVAVAEVNADYNTCQISWGRELSRETLEDYGEEVEYFTRYPDNGEAAFLIDSAEGNDVNAPTELLELPAEDGE